MLSQFVNIEQLLCNVALFLSLCIISELMYKILLLLSLVSFQFGLAARVTFEQASSEETANIQEHLISFYSGELLQAGLVKDREAARKAASEELHQDMIDHPSNPYYYYHLISDKPIHRCGYIVYSINEKTAYLESIHLDESFRGRGLGKEALEALESEAKKRGIDGIKLYVFAHNKIAFALYKQMGYLIENTYSDGATVIGYHMKKQL